MYCLSCGEEIRDDSTYCKHCGADVTGDEDIENEESTSTDDTGTSAADTGKPDYGTDSHTPDPEATNPDFGTTGSGTEASGSNNTEESIPATSSEGSSNTFAAITHVIAYFTWIIGPIIIYLIADDDYLKENAANAFNWQFTLFIYLVISAVLIILLVGVLMIAIFALLDLIFVIVATAKAAGGEAWTYPITIEVL